VQHRHRHARRVRYPEKDLAAHDFKSTYPA
jgi:hypothetical protein